MAVPSVETPAAAKLYSSRSVTHDSSITGGGETSSR
jgi:hypothetical protein